MRTALITGASGGIGCACAKALAEAGFRVCLIARRQERLERIVRELQLRHGTERAVFLAGDVTSDSLRRAALDLMLTRWGRVDVLVNNAGTVAPGAIEEVDLGLVRQQFEVNVFACLAWMQHVGPIMRKQGGGRIINMSSVAGRLALPCVGAYAASKSALEAISDAARVEYKPWGVHVVVIEPGSIVTEIWQKARTLAGSTLPEWESSPFRKFYEAEHEHAEQLASGMGPGPEIVARLVRRAATARRPRARYRSPWDARLGSLVGHLPARLRDWLVRRMFGV